MAARPDVLWEAILSFHRLRERRRALMFGEWRAETRVRLSGETRLLAALVPPRGYFPDFLTPSEGACGLEASLEALRATPPGRLHSELALAAAGRAAAPGLPGRLSALAEGRPEALAGLVGALRSYHRAAIEPYWPHIQATVEADRAVRGRALLDGGAGELLASLPPVLRWRAPVLEADYPAERELHLNGRGLLLQPSFFCRGTPWSTATPAFRRCSSIPRPTAAHRPSASRATPRSASSSATPARSSFRPFATAVRPVNSPAGQGCRSPPPASTRRSCARRAWW